MEFESAYKRKYKEKVYEPGVSMTKQSFAAECDINKIMEKYEKTGLITHVNEAVAQYGDFTEILDYQGAIAAVKAAEEAFLTIPAKIRAQFDNDPQKFINYLQDPANLQEAVDAGLLVRKESSVVDEVKDEVKHEQAGGGQDSKK